MKTLRLKKVGKHYMEGNLYQDEKGNYYVDAHNKVKDDGISAVYILCPSDDPDGEPEKLIECHITITNPLTSREKEEEKYKFQYMLLDRMRMDCEYYQTAENLCNGQGTTIEKFFGHMKKTWCEIPEDLKPEWLTMEQINEYEEKFKKGETNE
jgi:hypothetical protein